MTPYTSFPFKRHLPELLKQLWFETQGLQFFGVTISDTTLLSMGITKS
jgi:hypothetical protein